MGTQVSAGLEGGDAATLRAGNVGGMSGEMSGWELPSSISPPLLLQPINSSKHFRPISRVSSTLPQPCPHSLMHLFMSGLRASKYPGGQDGKQTPTWRMSFLSSRMNSLGEHLRQPLTSEQSSQPLAQAWFPSELTARMEQG